jgi:transcriptional regulator with XRE-family HTH domain
VNTIGYIGVAKVDIFGQRMKFLKAIRDAKGWSRYEMAKRLRIKPKHKYYRYEKDENAKGMNIPLLLRISHVSGLSDKRFMTMLREEFPEWEDVLEEED